MKAFRRIIQDEKGATAIEYGLIAALICVAAIAALQGVGNQLNATMSEAESKMARASNPTPAS